MSTPVQGGQPELTGQVMFYRKPEPLSLERHRSLGVKQIPAPFSFLKTAHAVPITVSEFGVVATCFPIIFVGTDKTPVAVMGVRQNENEYVDASGQPDPDTYIPAFVRRYPFVFASDPKSDKLLLCVDTEAAMVSSSPDVPFFEGEKASKFTEDAIEFCKEFERQRRATTEFVEMLDKASLFEQKSVAFTPRDQQGNAGATQKIAALAAVYAHMVSLMNWQRVIQRTMRRLSTQATPQPN
jgi:hypothetical protein